ncbi:F-box protein, partial [Trifolium medium]|nr:F-box protein [Trifolium medium]
MAASEEEDRLSSLSDDILIGIISLNPTKDAVRTGVLSKRWVGVYGIVLLISTSPTSIWKTNPL